MKQKKIILFLIPFCVALTANALSAISPTDNSISSIISAYRLYKDFDNISINAPSVVEIPVTDEFIERFNFAVLNKTANSLEPYFFKQEKLIIPVSVIAYPNNYTASRMNDNDTRTYADFPLPNGAQGYIQITLSSVDPITSSALTVLLDDNVALPNSIEIRAFLNGQNRIVLANKRMNEQTIYFPKTTSNKWIISFTFSQPLRVSELNLRQDNTAKTSANAIRFLAQPAHSYRVYFNPDRETKISEREAGNLISAKDIILIPAAPSQNNPNYIIADTDNDGMPDIRDNCVSVANPDQQDINNNKRGDACDDFDQDGIINSKDNCPNNPNIDQKDDDSDNIGDVCDKEESRITERYAWIPWAGIGFAAIVLIILFILTARSTHATDKNNNAA